MRIDVWSDIACPWCWLGKRHLEVALERSGLAADVRFRAYELQPGARQSVPARDYLRARYGDDAAIDRIQARLAAMGDRVGLPYDFERQLMANTFDAHRVHKLAEDRGVGGAVLDRFMRAYHAEGADLADHATIRRLAVEAGLDAGDVDAALASDAYAAEVRRDEAEARAVGVEGVPFFVVDGTRALAGALPVEVFERALAEIAAARRA